jgi:eukaryotic-like serine/threonine-protein kinase
VIPVPERLGRYRILHQLGEGGMGVVYAAVDEELGRPVALKTIRDTTRDPASRERFRREARAAASVNHPNICHVYEIGEDDAQLFIAMERLEGESLAERLRRGPIDLPHAVDIVLTVLRALEPLHGRGLVHRDLKPSNIFVSEHGIKLLDFGLARHATTVESTLTMSGSMVGTPGYMSPEQIEGQPIDARTDIFSVGAILYELLVGRPAFTGRTMFEVLNATLNDAPPALGGSAAIAAVDRVVRRALARRPDDRFTTVWEMAHALQPALTLIDTGEAPRVQRMTRLIVLPFRMLRPDPEIDFLPFSLADAIASTLSGLGSLLVRSTAAASAYVGGEPDLKRLSTEAEVDVVLRGTLLRIADTLRVQAQLVAVPEGTILWSASPQASVTDLFQLQDDLARQLVDSLAVPLTARESRQLGRDVPASAKAYELFLRANQHFYHATDWQIALQLYLACVDEDPRFAPAWARLGRCYRLAGKFTSSSETDLEKHLGDANRAFQRALEINPDLPIAHNLYTFLEADLGRAPEAVERLLGQANARPNDPDVYAGLVHACRYSGLMDASLAAYQRASQLDPTVPTSIAHTYWMSGDYEHATQEKFGGYTFGYIRALALASSGRTSEAIAFLREREPTATGTMGTAYLSALRLLLEGRTEESRALLTPALLAFNPDPESRYYLARMLARVGAREEALGELKWIVKRGFHPCATLRRDPWLDDLRDDERFAEIVAIAVSGSELARARFNAVGGPRLLGL